MVRVGENLARLGVNPKRLAKKTGLSTERVDQIFHGEAASARELRLISEYLRLPIDALMQSQEILGQADLRYRKTPRKHPPFSAEVRTKEIASFLQRNKLIQTPNRPWRITADLSDRRSIEHAAMLVRRKICQEDEQLDPLSNLIERIDSAGLASCLSLYDLGVEGASVSLHGAGLIVVAARTFKPRVLFTCAHELAHVILGHTDSGRWLLDENTIEAFDTENMEERLCNALASAILQPAEGVARLLEAARSQYAIPEDALTATEVLIVARFFGTSFFAAAMRLEQLEIAPVGTASSFEKAIKADHKSLEIYAEYLGLPPRSPIHVPIISPTLRNSMSRAVEEGDVSLGRLADTLGYSLIEMSHALA